ncbi:MAG: YihY/virulence factor BrkB family protein [Bacteroidota bacterium]|nr:YihY/virulence factor BrkB family protein [Bacteroidota bacterium]
MKSFFKYITIFIRVLFKRIYLVGKTISYYSVFKIFKSKLIEDEIFERSLAVAFSFTIASFPLIIFLFTLLPYINAWIPEIDSEKILIFLQNIMPSDMFSITKNTILDLVETKRGGLLSIGVISSIFLSSNGFNTLIKTFNSCHRIRENRSFYETRLIAMLLTFVFFIVTIIAIVLSTLGDFIINIILEYNLFKDAEYYTINSYKLLSLFISFYLLITSIFYFAPVIHNKWTFISSGSIISAIGCVAISLAFSYYINNFPTYNKLYGSIGILIAYMGWVYVISTIILIGFEWNTSIDIAIKKLKSKFN